MADTLLMRHAAYDGHQTSYHAPPEAELTDQGRASVLSALPLPGDIAGIVTSPLRRAQETAEILSAHSDLPILGSDPQFAEWRAPRSVLGRTRDEYSPGYRAWRSTRVLDPERAFEDGESLAALHRRALQAAATLKSFADRYGSVLLVSHQILLGVLIRLDQGPAAFDAATAAPWLFTEIRPWKIP